MKNLPAYQETALGTWQEHTYSEFVLKDADAALATMSENPYVLLIASRVVRVGRAAVRKFYADKFLPNIPPDLGTTTLSQTSDDDRIVEEMAVRFTHTIDMDWLLPGVRPTGRKAEFIVAIVIQFDAGKIAHEHLYCDQATVLSQLGSWIIHWRWVEHAARQSFCAFGEPRQAPSEPGRGAHGIHG
jgi:carboxymethylenebutenolidase